MQEVFGSEGGRDLWRIVAEWREKSGLDQRQRHGLLVKLAGEGLVRRTRAQRSIGPVQVDCQHRGNINGDYFFLWRAAVSCSLSRTRLRLPSITAVGVMKQAVQQRDDASGVVEKPRGTSDEPVPLD